MKNIKKQKSQEYNNLLIVTIRGEYRGQDTTCYSSTNTGTRDDTRAPYRATNPIRITSTTR